MSNSVLRVYRDWHGEQIEFEPGDGDGILSLSVFHLMSIVNNFDPESNFVEIGQYRFKVVLKADNEFVPPQYQEWHLVLDNRYAAFYKWKYLIKKFFKDTNRRLIATVQIWGLIKYNPSVRPEWSDLKILKWLRGNDE